MELESRPSTDEWDLVSQTPDPRSQSHSEPATPLEPIEPYRRLVINPILAIVVGAGLIWLVQASLELSDWIWFFATLGVFGLASLFTLFHCLDCGRTIWLSKFDRHACEPTLARWREGRQERWAFPRLRTQFLVWLCVAAIVFWLLVMVRFLSG